MPTSIHQIWPTIRMVVDETGVPVVVSRVVVRHGVVEVLCEDTQAKEKLKADMNGMVALSLPSEYAPPRTSNPSRLVAKQEKRKREEEIRKIVNQPPSEDDSLEVQALRLYYQDLDKRQKEEGIST